VFTPRNPVESAALPLHETGISTTYPASSRRDGEHQGWKPIVIRYADDLVSLHPDHDVIPAIRWQVADWLTGVVLELHPTKSRIVYTLHEHEGHRPGFDFLGFSVRQHPIGKTHAGRDRVDLAIGSGSRPW
jgi:RNA-directed DNA polymerase